MGLRSRLALALALVSVVPLAAIAWRAEPVLFAFGARLADASRDRAGAVVAARLAEEERASRAALERWRLELLTLDRPVATLFDPGGGPLTRKRRRDLGEEAAARAARAADLDVAVLLSADPDGTTTEIDFIAGVVNRPSEASTWPEPGAAAWRVQEDGRHLALRVVLPLAGADRDSSIRVGGERLVARADLERFASGATGAEVRLVPRLPGAGKWTEPGEPVHLAADGNVIPRDREATARPIAAVAVVLPPGADPVPLLRDELLRVALLGAVLAVIAGLAIAHLVTRPLRRLTRAVSTVAEGEPPPGAMPTGPGEVGRLAAAVDRMLAALTSEQRGRVEAERRAAWREIARRVAHEVRNPLSPIRLAVANLRRAGSRGSTPADPAVEVELAAIDAEVSRIDRMVREFAEFARLPETRPAPVRVADVVEPAVRGQVPEDGDIRVEFEVDEELAEPILLDADLLGQAFANLARNSVEALEGRGGLLRVRLRTSTTARGRSCAEITVDDDGPGLPEELRETLFEPYVTGRGDRGTGLGLALTRRIVTEHGGTIGADVSPLGGARFTVRLPLDGHPLESS